MVVRLIFGGAGELLVGWWGGCVWNYPAGRRAWLGLRDTEPVFDTESKSQLNFRTGACSSPPIHCGKEHITTTKNLQKKTPHITSTR